MFCKKCGSLIRDDATICPNCGAEVNSTSSNPAMPNQQVNYQINNPYESQSNGMAIAGFVCAFFIPLLGWIFGGIGLSRAKKETAKATECPSLPSLLQLLCF